MKSLINAVALFLVVGFGSASAQTITFASAPIATDQGNTLKVCGTLSGLGSNQAVTISISGSDSVTTSCTNPGGNVAPGQTSTAVSTYTASQQFTTDASGSVPFCLTTAAPAAGKCPNDKWTANVTDVKFSKAVITVNGQVVNY